MVSSLAVNNMITESRSIQNRILLEPIPFAGDTLQTIIEAMKENRQIELTYQGYGKSERNYLIEPYLTAYVFTNNDGIFLGILTINSDYSHLTELSR